LGLLQPELRESLKLFESLLIELVDLAKVDNTSVPQQILHPIKWNVSEGSLEASLLKVLGVRSVLVPYAIELLLQQLPEAYQLADSSFVLSVKFQVILLTFFHACLTAGDLDLSRFHTLTVSASRPNLLVHLKYLLVEVFHFLLSIDFFL